MKLSFGFLFVTLFAIVLAVPKPHTLDAEHVRNAVQVEELVEAPEESPMMPMSRTLVEPEEIVEAPEESPMMPMSRTLIEAEELVEESPMLPMSRTLIELEELVEAPEELPMMPMSRTLVEKASSKENIAERTDVRETSKERAGASRTGGEVILDQIDDQPVVVAVAPPPAADAESLEDAYEDDDDSLYEDYSYEDYPGGYAPQPIYVDAGPLPPA